MLCALFKSTFVWESLGEVEDLEMWAMRSFGEECLRSELYVACRIFGLPLRVQVRILVVSEQLSPLAPLILVVGGVVCALALKFSKAVLVEVESRDESQISFSCIVVSEKAVARFLLSEIHMWLV
jgi:hypothetical protein